MKVWTKISGEEYRLPSVAIFASGAGSNAEKIIDYLNVKGDAGKVTLIVCNNPAAGVLDIAGKNAIDTILLQKDLFFTGNSYITELQNRGIDFIVLAGFLWKLPLSLVQAYPNKIINIHPALLPKYGGKGMYGNRVHEAVIAAGEKESGITIHYVDELYDHGNIILQATCQVEGNETAGSLAKKIHGLEHAYYPTVIEGILLKMAE